MQADSCLGLSSCIFFHRMALLLAGVKQSSLFGAAPFPDPLATLLIVLQNLEINTSVLSRLSSA